MGRPQLAAVGSADRGVEQAQVIVDLSDGADGGAGAAARSFCSMEMAGAEAFNGVDVGPLDLIEELARRRRRAFRRTGAGPRHRWCQRRGTLARAGEAGDYVRVLRGMRTLMSRKLCWRAPRTEM